MRWDLMVLAALVYTAVIVPWEVAFMDSQWPWTGDRSSYLGTAWPNAGDQRVIAAWEPPRVWAALLYVCDRWTDAVFMSDILLTFNLGSYDATRTRLESRRSVLATRYIAGPFLLDLVSTVPYDLIVAAANNQALAALRALRILKLLRMARAFRVIRRIEEASSMPVAYLRLVRCFLGLLFTYHWLACGLWAISGASLREMLDLLPNASPCPAAFENREDNWVSMIFNAKYGVAAADPLVMVPCASQVYTEALLWIVARNPNRIQMQTNAERSYAMTACLIVELLTAYLVGSLFEIVAMLNKRNKAFDELLDELNLFVEAKRLPPELARRLRSYMRLQHPAYNEKAVDSWAELLTHFPRVLRAEVVATIGVARSLDGLPYFGHLPEALVLAIAQEVRFISFPPGEALTLRGDDSRTGSVMVLRKGMVLARTTFSTKILASTLDVHILSEEAFFPGERIVESGCVTLNACEMHCIVVETLNRLLAEMPADLRHQVVRVARGRWLMRKCSRIVPAAARVKALLRQLAARPGARALSFLELLNAADGGAMWPGNGSHQHRHDTAAWSVGRNSRPVDLSALGNQDPKTRDMLREALFNPAESAYVMPPQLALLVVSRAAPLTYEAAELAALRIQRLFRAYRYRFKFARLRDGMVAQLRRDPSLTGRLSFQLESAR